MMATAGEPTTLSRASDHLGNLVKDLGGGGTLQHELTPNANDADADRITFVATGEEPAFWNSAVFSDCEPRSEQIQHPAPELGRVTPSSHLVLQYSSSTRFQEICILWNPEHTRVSDKLGALHRTRFVAITTDRALATVRGR